MKARGKRGAKRSASPLVTNKRRATSPERAEYGCVYLGLSGLDTFAVFATRARLALKTSSNLPH
jgi:hypothetical protein